MRVMKEEKQEKGEVLQKILIRPVNRQVLCVKIVGTAPLVMNRFGKKAREAMIARQKKGDAQSKRQKRNLPPKDFDALFLDSLHISREGWYGIPAHGIRAGMVRACKLVNYQMTDAKMAFFVEADGYDRNDETPLVRIIKGRPVKHIMPARNDDGSVDMRCRAMFAAGWEADVRVGYDADLFEASSVANLVERVGQQIGVLEGRPFSKDSCGMGWGTFTTLTKLRPRMVGR